MNIARAVATLVTLLALPLSTFAHPGAEHQHSAAEVLIIGGLVLLVAVVIGVLARRKSASAKTDVKQNGL